MLASLQSVIHYDFKDISLLRRAMTHPSNKTPFNNQRLEFLGDTVLGLVIAQLIYTKFQTESEGDLARRHAALVCGTTLAQVGKTLGLGKYLILNESEEASGGRENPTNIEDACEALIAAIYLDGGLEAAEQFILSYWMEIAESVSEPPKDAKTALQEWTQARNLGTPEYIMLDSTGPAHAPEFTIEIRIKGYPALQAKGSSKRAAEQLVAQTMLTAVEHT